MALKRHRSRWSRFGLFLAHGASTPRRGSARQHRPWPCGCCRHRVGSVPRSRRHKRPARLWSHGRLAPGCDPARRGSCRLVPAPPPSPFRSGRGHPRYPWHRRLRHPSRLRLHHALTPDALCHDRFGPRSIWLHGSARSRLERVRRRTSVPPLIPGNPPCSQRRPFWRCRLTGVEYDPSRLLDGRTCGWPHSEPIGRLHRVAVSPPSTNIAPQVAQVIQAAMPGTYRPMLALRLKAAIASGRPRRERRAAAWPWPDWLRAAPPCARWRASRS